MKEQEAIDEITETESVRVCVCVRAPSCVYGAHPEDRPFCRRCQHQRSWWPSPVYSAAACGALQPGRKRSLQLKHTRTHHHRYTHTPHLV